ncbi:MAG: hypothetical protein JXQ85_03925 [Cognatishimia sp.]|uniref:hypothetical protein n=1 Tax=Cognatishimia sp. TaxID=2211648 RepID=UPI003B8AEC8F
MNHAIYHNAQKELAFEISYLIAKFGRRKALLAILFTYWKGKGRPPDTAFRMSNHLRSDIGLAPFQEPPPAHRSETI